MTINKLTIEQRGWLAQRVIVNWLVIGPSMQISRLLNSQWNIHVAKLQILFEDVKKPMLDWVHQNYDNHQGASIKIKNF